MSDNNLIYLDTLTTLDVPVERVLGCALEAEMTEAVVVGYDKDGQFYFASSKASGGDVMWLLTMAQKKLLEVVEG